MRKPAALALCALLLSCARRAPPPPEAFKLEDSCAAKLARSDWEGARRDCAEAARMLPESPVAWPSLAVALLQLHQLDEARPALEKAARYADRDPRVHNGLGIVAFTDRRYPEAEAQFKRALELNADYAQARFNRAWNFFRWRRYADAAAQLRELMVRKPELAEAPHFLGLILLTEDRLEDATETLIDAVEKEPRDCRIWLALATAYGRQQRFEEAERALGTCLDVCPGLDACKAQLDRARRRDVLPLPDPHDLEP